MRLDKENWNRAMTHLIEILEAFDLPEQEKAEVPRVTHCRSSTAPVLALDVGRGHPARGSAAMRKEML